MPEASCYAEETEELAKDYIYFKCIHQIRLVKPKLHFSDAQPMLQDISSLPEWTCIVTGIEKLFVNDVLGQLQVLTKLHFGSLFKYV